MEPQGSNVLRVGDAIGYGWSAFKKYPGPLVVVAVVVLVVNAVFSGLGSSLGRDAAGVRALLQLTGWLVSILLSLGLIRVSLKVTRGEEPEVADLFLADGFAPYLGASIIFGLAVAVGLLLCIVPGIIVAIILGFFGFAIVDRGDGVGDAFRRSSDITKGQRGTLFVLGLAILGINILGAILCGVGLLVSYPVTIVAGGYAYRVLSNQPIAPIAP